jgi:peptidoglycan/xylan/chitin deacetylase (PgdA/CDA1 family)
MLLASHPIRLLDRYRVPYEVDPSISDSGAVRIRRADGAELVAVAAPLEVCRRPHFLGGAFLFGALADHRTLADHVPGFDPGWQAEMPILDQAGAPESAVYRAPDETLVVPFDLDEPFESLLREEYLPASSRRIRELLSGGYYRVRPLFPYSLQMAMRRRFLRVQDRLEFPAWPTEASLHRLESLMLALVERVSGERLPWLAPWPAPYDWALVLTHDVEHEAGYQYIDKVLALEERRRLRSAWYLVPERDYVVHEDVLDRLRAAGCEICLHGLRHDGRDMSPKSFRARLPAMRSYLEKWGANGFRAPATHRDRELIAQLGVKHDSSWSDVARYEPQPGGSCSWLPFFIGDVVELPITLPMDHTLFELRRERTAERWIEKASFIRDHGGMALIVTHPDYLMDGGLLSRYDDFLEHASDDGNVWHALPGEIADWWQRRAETRIERGPDGWAVVGAASSDAVLRLGAPPAPPSSLDGSRTVL